MHEYKLGDVAFERKETCSGNKDNYPIVGLEHIIPEQVILTEWDQGSENTFTKFFRTGDVLFGRRRAYLKKAAVAPFDGICSGDITVIAAKEDILSPRLLPFIIQNDMLFDYAVKMSAGGLSPRVKWQNLKDFVVVLPDMEKQEELAEILWSMEYTKRAYRNMIAQTDELVKSQFIELFDTANGWPLIKLEQLCDSIVRGPFGSALKVSFFVERGIDTVKVYEQKNAIQGSAALGDSYITKERYQTLERFSCGPGDFIMSCSGTIGCLYQLPDTAEHGIINQALCKFRLNSKMLPEVFLTYMRNSVDQLETKGSAIQNIGAVSYIKNMEIALPPMHIQEQFAAFIRQSDKSKFELQKALDELTAMQKKLMLNIFSEQ